MLSRALRIIEYRFLKRLSSFHRVLILKLKHPNINLKNTIIGKNCEIYCMPGGAKMSLINCTIDDNVRIRCGYGGELYFNNVFVGRNSVISVRDSLTIEEGTLLAEMVVIRDQDHGFRDKTKPILEQGYKTDKIHIGKHVWVGAKVTILKGSKIGDRAVIGAHSLVKGELEPESIYMGDPAKKIKSF